MNNPRLKPWYSIVSIMNNPRYDCPIPNCQESRVSKDFLKHFLKHSNSELSGFLELNALKCGRTTSRLVNLETLVNKKKREIRCCFGCEKIFIRDYLYMEHSSGCKKKGCKNKDKHKLKCKEILESMNIKEEEPETITAIKNILGEFPEVKGFLELNYPDLLVTCLKN